MTRYYTTGEFARKAQVTIRTIRYYDKQGLLKPSRLCENGYRMYTDEDFLRLQKILSLKYLGFSLKEIANMTINDDGGDIRESLKLQIGLVQRKIENMQQMEHALRSTVQIVEQTNRIDWDKILNLIHLTDMEKRLVEQYKDGANLNIRIALHASYAANQQGWFPWLYEQLELQGADRILEVGCGNGELWKCAGREQLQGKYICLSDVSEGMIQDAKNNLDDKCFDFRVLDCQELPFPAGEYQRVVANHVLFYAQNIDSALKEIGRVLTEDGIFYCSTYGCNHMKEITELVQEFDSEIYLSSVALYKLFGLENGEELLAPYFAGVEKRMYEDHLWVDKAEPLLDYIMSCHGNQSELLYSRRQEFREFLQRKIEQKGGIYITKEAGVFVCREPIRQRSIE